MTEWVECRACHRPLRDPEARAIGYGRDCARKRGLLPPKKPRRARSVRRPKPATVPPAPDAIPGQDELPLFFHQPSLGSL